MENKFSQEPWVFLDSGFLFLFFALFELLLSFPISVMGPQNFLEKSRGHQA